MAACVLFLFLYICAYDMFIDPVTFIYTAEIWPTNIRSKGLALAWFAYFVGAITWTTPSQLAFKTIGWRMYIIWFACNIVTTIVFVSICHYLMRNLADHYVQYFYLPETKGVPLEEMGDLFGDEVVVHLAQDGRGIVESDKMTAEHVEETPKQG